MVRNTIAAITPKITVQLRSRLRLFILRAILFLGDTHEGNKQKQLHISC